MDNSNSELKAIKDEAEDHDDDSKNESRRSDHITMDEIYQEIGEFGPWQWINLGLLWLPSLASGIIVITFSFTGLIIIIIIIVIMIIISFISLQP